MMAVAAAMHSLRETTIPTETLQDADEREDLIAVRRIAEVIPSLRDMAESIGARRVAELLMEAEERANALCEATRSAEAH